MSHDSDEPKIYFLPNLMTAGNLACGFFAVLSIFYGMSLASHTGDFHGEASYQTISAKQYYEITQTYYQRAILLIFGSCLFDLLDGRLARMGGQDSPFGREFDSLADIVSFGLAPALLVCKAVLFPLPANVGWFIAFLYLLCGAMRLARFNCLATLPKKNNDKAEFRGIPIPMAAGFISSLTFLIFDVYREDRELGNWKFVLAGAMIGLSWLMMSNIRYPSFKKLDLNSKTSMGAIVAVALILILTVKYYTVMPVVLFSSYLLWGLIRPLMPKRMQSDIEAALTPFEIEPEDDHTTPQNPTQHTPPNP